VFVRAVGLDDETGGRPRVHAGGRSAGTRPHRPTGRACRPRVRRRRDSLRRHCAAATRQWKAALRRRDATV
jgi:hypothetical protein